MFPLGLLATLGSVIGAYKYGKKKGTKTANSSSSSTSTSTSSDDSTAKNINTYNYYTNESESGNTLFGSQKKTKRTLFGNENI
jgi:hypothetical protein